MTKKSWAWVCLISYLVSIICFVRVIFYQFNHIDMTGTRVLVNTWEWGVAGAATYILGAIAYRVGYKMKTDEEE